MTTVNAVFGTAVRDGLITRNPCAGLELPEVVKTEVLIPSDEQFTEILDALRYPWYRRMVIATASTGLRSGEIRGLTEDRVNWLGRTVKVDRQLVSVVGGVPELGPLKTEASYRTVPVAQCVIDVMATELGEHGAGPGGLIFTNQRRNPMCGKTIGSTLSPFWIPSGGRKAPGCTCSATTTRPS
ncbi:MAG: tyrosine-type recombinase/integrase [Pseudonocardiaceae bacterium]